MNRYFCILLLLCSSVLFSQGRIDLRFIHYATDHGLSSNEALCLAQDDLGFIWIGTADGLNRFDGYSFKVYRKEFNDSTSLCDNYIKTLYVDSRKGFWIGTQKGLSYYNRDQDYFINYYPFDGDYTSQSNNVSSIAEDNEGNIFVSLERGIYKFSQSGTRFTKVLSTKQEIKYLFFDSKNLLWVLTGEDIYIYSNNLDPVDTIINPKVKYSYTCMVEDDDKYWISTEGSGLFCYDKQTRSLVREFQNNIYEDYVGNIYKDKDNNIWVGTASSLKLYDKEKDLFHYYYYNENDKHSFSTSGIKAIFQDKESNYWVLSAHGGANVSLVRKQFKNIKPGPGYGLTLSQSRISSMFIDSDDRIWAGAFGAGLDIVDYNYYSVTHYENDPSKTNSLGPHSVLMMFEDSKKNIWVGTYRGGLQLYNKETETFKFYKHNPDDIYSIGGNDIRAIAEDKNGNLWLATAGDGLDKFDTKNERFYHYRHDEQDIESSLINDWLYALLYDSEGNLWIGSSFGLSKYNIEKNTFTNYYNDPSDSTSLSNNYINYIFEDSKNRLWIATNEGLNLFNRDSKTFKSYLQKNGLPNSVIKGIQEDEHGNLWISSNKGISSFDPVTESFRNYDIYDGLPSNEFSSGACAKNNRGMLFFACDNGIASFYPDSIKDVLSPPSVFITGLKLLNRQVMVGEYDSLLKKNIIETKEITLDHSEASVISFEFVSISYIQSERKQYAYKMEGFDKDWVYCGTKREVTYTNLDPGRYTFRVIASNHDNQWNKEGAAIHVTILPPWWEKVWFRLLAILFLLSLVVSVFIIKTNTLQVQKHKLEKLVKERTQEIEEKNKSLIAANATKDKMFSIIAHDLKNPFNSILGFSQLLDLSYDKFDDKKRKKYIKNISDSSESLYQLLENLLHWGRSQSGTLNYEPEVFPILEVVKMNVNLLQYLFAQKQNQVKIDVPEHIEVFADKNMISTVIRNLLSNANKFTDQGETLVSVIQKESIVQITIQDTGIGMTMEQQKALFNIGESMSTAGTQGETGTGLGLIVSKEFIEKNNGTITVKSEIGKGTTFKILLPAHAIN